MCQGLDLHTSNPTKMHVVQGDMPNETPKQSEAPLRKQKAGQMQSCCEGNESYAFFLPLLKIRNASCQYVSPAEWWCFLRRVVLLPGE